MRVVSITSSNSWQTREYFPKCRTTALNMSWKEYLKLQHAGHTSLLLCSTRLVLTITASKPPPLPLYQFDLVGSSRVCSHTCTPFYPHSSHSGNMLTDSCTSKDLLAHSLSWLSSVMYARERVRERMSLRQPVVLWGQFGWLALKCKLKRASLCSFKVTRARQCNVKLSSPCLCCVRCGDWQKLLVIV